MESPKLSDFLHYAPNSGVYPLPDSGREAMQQAAGEAELVFHLVNFEDCEEPELAIELVGEGMVFPEYFGKNLDALYDCLTDLTWQESSASVIVLTGCDALAAAAPEDWRTLLGVFLAAAEFWRDEDVPFWVFIDMRADELSYLPSVG